MSIRQHYLVLFTIVWVWAVFMPNWSKFYFFIIFNLYSISYHLLVGEVFYGLVTFICYVTFLCNLCFSVYWNSFTSISKLYTLCVYISNMRTFLYTPFYLCFMGISFCTLVSYACKLQVTRAIVSMSMNILCADYCSFPTKIPPPFFLMNFLWWAKISNL